MLGQDNLVLFLMIGVEFDVWLKMGRNRIFPEMYPNFWTVEFIIYVLSKSVMFLCEVHLHI